MTVLRRNIYLVWYIFFARPADFSVAQCSPHCGFENPGRVTRLGLVLFVFDVPLYGVRPAKSLYRVIDPEHAYKLLADGAYVEGQVKRGSVLKRIYRLPMDLLEETTTSMMHHIVI